MQQSSNSAAAQTVYESYHRASTLAEAQAWLNVLLSEFAAPLVQTIIQKKLRALASAADLQDLEQQVHVKWLTCLEAPPDTHPQNFASYLAVITFNTCADWLRQRQPQRHALKNRLRYVLTHTPGLALWETQPRVWWSGQTDWQNSTRAVSSTTLAHCCAALSASARQGKLTELVTALFAKLGQPVELDDLVNALADWLGIGDAAAGSFSATSAAERKLAEASPDLETRIERQAQLQQLWQEICQLPLNQRRALLLNLRDAHGKHQLALFHLTGIASLRELAAALGTDAETLATWWNELPFDDLKLAEQLGLTRQQVINLRLAARRRLLRRTGYGT